MREETWLNDYVFTVDEFFSSEECRKYIEIAEDIGFEEALVTTPTGSVRASLGALRCADAATVALSSAPGFS